VYIPLGAPGEAARISAQLWAVPQVPPLHASPAAHRTVHAPQCAASSSVRVSHPFALAPSQSPYPATHAMVHPPPVHVGIAFAAEGHAFPHAPQLDRSTRRSAHVPLHCC
jgi:hypothetical protein